VSSQKQDDGPGRPEPDAGDDQQEAGPGSQPQVPRILIVEDEPVDAELAQRLLANAGLAFTARVVDTLAAFTEQLSDFIPDLILSDFSLPGFTGADALKIAQDQCPQIPFIVWSGALGDEAAVELIKHGATDYVLKDRPARLPSAIDRALTEARQRARIAEIESQLGLAQRLASHGHLAAAEQLVTRARQWLAAERGTASGTAPQPPGTGAERYQDRVQGP
jgi:DNA-binding NtrC family response regulator